MASDITRANSLKNMREAVVSSCKIRWGDTGQSSTNLNNPITTLASTTERTRKKKSLSHWKNYSTISWRVDEQKDFRLEQKISAPQGHGRCWVRVKKTWHWLVSWVVPALIGIATAISGHYIEIGVNYLNPLRLGYCTKMDLSHDECEEKGATWVMYSEMFDFRFAGYLFYVLGSVALAFLSACLVWAFAPMARGSGIPEVKTILGGFCMNEALEFKTLVVKMIGLTLSVSSGMALGKEGPLVHVACCWSHLLSGISTRYAINEAKRRELLSTAAAAGVSVAFGAPLGGVLFSFEEVSTMFPTKTMIRAFFAASIAALTLQLLNAQPGSNHRRTLTMFVTKYEEAPHYSEYPFFLMLGIIGGLVGALFVHWNMWITAKRADGSRWRRRVPIIIEVVLIAAVTGITSYPIRYSSEMSSETIRALFHNCQDPERPEYPGMPNSMMGLCRSVGEDESVPKTSLILMGHLLMAALIKFLQMTITFGTGVPCGLFVPSLFTGACLGRVFGMVVRRWHYLFFFFPVSDINPGVYAMVGAAAVLSGVCRVTISLVVIMFELTDGLQMVVPFMLAVLTAKVVGEQFTGGIYDCCIAFRGYPYLHEPDDITFTSRACDIMDSEIDCLTLQPGTMDELLAALENTRFAGLPLVRTQDDPVLIGFVFKTDLIAWIKQEKKENVFVSGTTQVAFKEWCTTPRAVKGIDLSEHVDLAVMRIVPETPLAQVHNIFRQLGIKTLLITKFGALVGIITKKAYLAELHSGTIGHITDDPIVLNHQARVEAEGLDPTNLLVAPMKRQLSPIGGSPSRVTSQASRVTFRLSHRNHSELEEGLLNESDEDD